MNRLLTVEDGADGAVIRFIPHSINLDAVNAEVMAHFLNAFLDGRQSSHLDFDFGPVEFVTSEALGVLVGLYKRVAATGGRVTLLNLRDEVYDIFAVTKLTQLFCVRRKQDSESGGRLPSRRGP